MLPISNFALRNMWLEVCYKNVGVDKMYQLTHNYYFNVCKKQ